MLVVSILLAMSCAAASIPWLARAAGLGPRVKDLASASQAAMSVGMAVQALPGGGGTTITKVSPRWG